MNAILRDVIFILGLLLVTAGAWGRYGWAAGAIVAGALLIAAVLVDSRPRP